MGLKDSSKELNNYANISPLSSDIDIPLYVNTPIAYNKKYPYSSQSSSSSSSDTLIIKKYPSIPNSNHFISSHQKNIYANISKLSTDTTLLNTINMGIKSLNLNENNHDNKQIYENLKLVSSSSSIYMNLNHDEKDTNELEQANLEIKTKHTVEKSEVNMTPNCNDKRDLYRTKIPSTITRIFPTPRQRRALYRPRRYRRRSSTAFRTITCSNAMRRQQQQHSNNRRLSSTNKIVSNQLYNEIQQANPSDNQSINSFYTEEIFESPTGELEEGILCWYPVENALIPQVFSTSENGESIEQDELTNEEEEKELNPHKTFEDFLLRRPSKSTYSSLASVTNTLLSKTSSPEIPVQSSTLNRCSSGVTLSLDKKDVDFIHNIIQRTHGHQRVSNRITALREAYLRAENKRNDLLKIKPIISQNNENKLKKKPSMKHSLIASKIRDELVKYDELPIHRKNNYSDDDDDDDDEDEDERYSINDNYRYRHRKLPPVPSTTNRIRNFFTTLKRQLQKNFHEIRSKILIEAMSNSSQRRPIIHNHTLGLSHRYRPQGKTSSNFIHRTNSHQSVEHSNPFHRHELSRTHSDISQIHSHYHPFSRRPRTFQITPHLQRRQRMI